MATHSGSAKADTSAVTISSAAPVLKTLSLTPSSTSLQPGGTRQFYVSATWSDGSTAVPVVTWSATGGTITGGGLYAAGTTAGTYRVIATQQGGTLADTSEVATSQPATLVGVVITPDSGVVQTGQTFQFSASGVYSNGTTGAARVTWSATGGSISWTGLYTGGLLAGNFRVTATSGSLADTVGVRVASSAVLSSFTLTDFAMLERFDLTYIGSDGKPHRPVMLHRVILGAMERFIGVLIEHYGGAFPVWLAPVQAILLTVTERHVPYAEGLCRRLLEKGIRVKRDFRNEKLGFKIREAQLQKIPYMLVIGDKEEKDGTVSPRKRSGESMKPMGVEEFITHVESEAPTLSSVESGR